MEFYCKITQYPKYYTVDEELFGKIRAASKKSPKISVLKHLAD